MRAAASVRSARALTLVAAAALVAAAPPSFAQTTDTGSGPLVLEELHSGIVIAPENRITDLDGRAGNLIGGSIGFLTDDTVMVGAGGYWLSNGSRARELGYGGLVAYWSPLRSGPLSLQLGGLVGAGGGTLDVQVQGLAFPSRRFDGRRGGPIPDDAQTVTRTLLVHRDFFVAEPQARASFRIAPWLRLGVGVGYRFVSGADSLDDRLRGVSGSVALQLGTF